MPTKGNTRTQMEIHAIKMAFKPNKWQSIPTKGQIYALVIVIYATALNCYVTQKQ